MKALVVFHGYSTHPLARLLKRGFRHVFVVFAAGAYWVSVDGRQGVPVVRVVSGTDFDLAGWCRKRGYAVVEVEQGPGPRAPFVVANCVGLAKALLGIRAPFVWTPYQLYRHLRKQP